MYKVALLIFFFQEFYNPGSETNIHYWIVIFSIRITLFILLDGSWIFQSDFQITLISTPVLVKLLRERMVNLQTGNEYLF